MSLPGNRRLSGGSGRFQKDNRARVQTRFRPGVSGNPKGRPRTKIVRRIAEETDPKTHRVIAEELVQTLVSRALRSSLTARWYLPVQRPRLDDPTHLQGALNASICKIVRLLGTAIQYYFQQVGFNAMPGLPEVQCVDSNGVAVDSVT